MKIEFVGGARTVTGSSFIIKDHDFTIMVDCGMFQGKRDLKDRNHLSLIYAPGKIDSLILTHAHIDHSGLIPKLVKEGFYGNIYATKATCDLCSIMLPDSAHIQEMDVEWQNRRNKRLGRDLVKPIYTVDDAEAAVKNFVPVSYGKKIQIHPRIHIQFRDAGHILGSSFVEMWIDEADKQTKIVFSGDLGTPNQALIRNPEIIEDADILLIESTYGNRLHKNKEDTYEEFKNVLIESHDQQGNIIIPSFAVERTQEIIYNLREMFKDPNFPKIPVYIDSPLAIGATEIFKSNADCFNKETLELFRKGENPLEFPTLTYVKTNDESKKLNDEAKGSIIISASGMCTAGRIKYHLMNNLYMPHSSVIFVGYQAEGTLGRRIVDGAKQVKIFGEDVSVQARIVTLGGFSAHADKNGLLDWLSNIKNPKLKVFVVHGEEEAANSLADAIKTKFGFITYVPGWGEIVDVNTMRSEVAEYGHTTSFTTIDLEIDSLQRSVQSFLEQFKLAKEKNKIRDLKKLEEDINDAREMLAILIDEL